MKATTAHAAGRSPVGAFTLVEVLIVLVLLGIIAAIVVPQYSSGADESRRVATLEQLRQLRATIELYRTQHEGQLPNITGNWDALTKASTFKGRALSPYLSLPPRNPLNDLTTVRDGDVGTPATGTGVGFIYDYAGGTGSGRIVATGPDGLGIFSEH